MTGASGTGAAKNVWTWLIVTVVLVIIAGIALVWLSAALTNRADELWLEAGKAGMQLLVLGVLGGLLTAGWQRAAEHRSEERTVLAERQQREHEEAQRASQRDLERHERRLQREHELHERQLSTFLQVVSAYNGIKAVRRRLTSLGFGKAQPDHVIDEWQAAGFHRSLADLSEYQLVFEAISRELRETRLYGDDSGTMVEDLDAIEKYVNRVVDYWEKHGAEIRPGARSQAATRGVEGIVEYAAFNTGVVVHRRRLTQAMHRHLFKAAGAESNT
jgi:membrane protein implicated in regulation of membrane protease activity